VNRRAALDILEEGNIFPSPRFEARIDPARSVMTVLAKQHNTWYTFRGINDLWHYSHADIRDSGRGSNVGSGRLPRVLKSCA
jgi:hypothetical protein